MIKTQFSRDIKVFRSDNAQEYCDTFFHAFYEHKALFPIILVLGKAALTATYIIKRVSSALFGNLTPYEHLYGTPPDYHFFRVFGCACFALLQPHERTKLKPRSHLGCFLGYGIKHKGYRCWDPLSRRLRDVDVPAVLPDDAPHAAPSTTVYPVESPSTDFAPPVAPFVPLSSDLFIRHSTPASTIPLWQQAMTEELQALDKSHTWDRVDLPPSKYIIRLLDCKTTSTPQAVNVCLTSLNGELLSDVTLYRQLVGRLIYLTITRLDIAHAIHLVIQFMSAPRSTYYVAVLHILFHGLHFSS
ncbi:hypothetical protein Acr_25g0000770 [Actinidia rufa]|uniref:Retroviral polymerase SH3-like domain-containing protein n=1 Tax=Actinidia rufa TaxID=165716 RepID=A0A7J0GY62_9ERIC|nr:hypothetical protein Acr_25g0000770 [Actinidia rufa]